MGHHHHIHDHHDGHTHHHHHAQKNIGWAFFLNLGFTLIEIIGGMWTNSMAILADALHDLGDTLALGMAWYLQKVSAKGRDQTFSYGYKRFSLLGALISSCLLIVGSIFILIESIPRLLHPEAVQAEGIVFLAFMGVGVNGFAAWRLGKGSSLNEQALKWHLLEDVLGWVLVLIMGVILWITPAFWLDPLVSIGFTCYILWNILKVFKETSKIFLQCIPTELDSDVLRQQLVELPHIENVHDIHLWSLDGQAHVGSVHIAVTTGMDMKVIQATKQQARQLLHSHGIEHATIEIEWDSEECSFQDGPNQP